MLNWLKQIFSPMNIVLSVCIGILVVVFIFVRRHLVKRIDQLTEKIDKISTTASKHEQLSNFFGLFIAFASENNFEKKALIATRLEALLVTLPKNQATVPLNYFVNIPNHLDNELANNLHEQVRLKNTSIALALINKELDKVSSTYPRTRTIVRLLAEKGDFGFMPTLQKVYGEPTTNAALDRFKAAKSQFEVFHKKYSLEHNTILNNFDYISQELDKRGSSNVRQICLEWINRGAHPSQETYRKLQHAVDG